MLMQDMIIYECVLPQYRLRSPNSRIYDNPSSSNLFHSEWYFSSIISYVRNQNTNSSLFRCLTRQIRIRMRPSNSGIDFKYDHGIVSTTWLKYLLLKRLLLDFLCYMICPTSKKKKQASKAFAWASHAVANLMLKFLSTIWSSRPLAEK